MRSLVHLLTRAVEAGREGGAIRTLQVVVVVLAISVAAVVVAASVALVALVIYVAGR